MFTFCYSIKFYPDSDPLFEELCARADDNLFAEITRNNEHVLHRFLPPKKIINYSLRDRKHPYTLPTKDDRTFFNRVLFKLWQSFICILILLLMLCLICGLTDYGIKKKNIYNIKLGHPEAEVFFGWWNSLKLSLFGEYFEQTFQINIQLNLFESMSTFT